MKGERRFSRQLALQCLYEIDLVDHPVGVVLEHRFQAHQDTMTSRVRDYCRELVVEIIRHRDLLDEYIQRHASEWPLDQVSIIDRNLLRMALYEFTIGHVPVKVAINEAVELAKNYGADSAPRFVNGVLGALVSKQQEITAALLAEIDRAEELTE